jgi:hypothetical protein
MDDKINEVWNEVIQSMLKYCLLTHRTINIETDDEILSMYTGDLLAYAETPGTFNFKNN